MNGSCPPARWTLLRAPRAAAVVACLLVAACAKVSTDARGGTGGTGVVGGGGSGGQTLISADAAAPDLQPGGGGGPPPITDFPSTPILGTATTPANAPALFGATPRTNGAPCVTSPAPGTLMPRNWLRPRFDYKSFSGENLFEIQLQVASFATTLRIYTTDPTYALDAALWNQLRVSVTDQPISVTIRGMTLSSTGTVQLPPSAPATTSFTVAPVDAPGKIVYWALPSTANGTGDGILRGFGIGEESVEDVLVGAQVQARTAGQDSCIGCHAATPDGLSVGFAFGPPQNMIGSDTYFDTIADIQQGTAGNLPTYVSPTALATIRSLRGIPAYSKGHWADGDRIVLLGDAQNHGDLLWVQVDGTAQGVLARTGDARGAVEPTFSHDGTRIVYVSTTSIHDGRLGTAPADLYAVPYGARAGGAATPLAGAADATSMEYYPAFSPDDAFVAFTAVPTPAGSTPDSYDNYQSEVFVVPSAGGARLRLAANDAPACANQSSPGLTNDWSKWSPEAVTAANGRTYYWLVFSSKRSGSAQLYITALVTGSEFAGGPQSYPALYLWNQPVDESNHTPSWDNYNIPPIVMM